MRIISGVYKGRRFTPPDKLQARPTTDFAKEGLFNILDNRINYDNLNVLDLFAGTGSISYEFASRGAGSVTSVELNNLHASYIRQMAETLQFKQLHVLRANVFDFVDKPGLSYGFIFADPPYQLDKLPDLPDLIFKNQLLAEGGIFVLEHGRDHQFLQHPHFVEERKYGNVHFSFFQ